MVPLPPMIGISSAPLFSSLLMENLGVSAILQGAAPTRSFGAAAARIGEMVETHASKYADPFPEPIRNLRRGAEKGAMMGELRYWQSKLGDAVETVPAFLMDQVMESTGLEAMAEEWVGLQRDIPSRTLEKVLRTFATAGGHLELLADLTAIPTVSTNPHRFPNAYFWNAARLITEAMREAGLQNIQILQANSNVRPSIFGETEPVSGAPTILLATRYGVYPPAATPIRYDPFSPLIHNGRLFGTGVHFKAGVVAVLAALKAFQLVEGTLPVHVAFYAEGPPFCSPLENRGTSSSLDHINPDLIVMLDAHNLNEEELPPRLMTVHDTEDDTHSYYNAMQRAAALSFRREQLAEGLHMDSRSPAFMSALRGRFEGVPFLSLDIGDPSAEISHEKEAILVNTFHGVTNTLITFLDGLGG